MIICLLPSSRAKIPHHSFLYRRDFNLRIASKQLRTKFVELKVLAGESFLNHTPAQTQAVRQKSEFKRDSHEALFSTEKSLSKTIPVKKKILALTVCSKTFFSAEKRSCRFFSTLYRRDLNSENLNNGNI